MTKIESTVSDYCQSEYFFFLDPAMKEFAENILYLFSKKIFSEIDHKSVIETLEFAERLDIPIDIKREIPYLLIEFLNYCETTPFFPEASEVADFVKSQQQRYRDKFRSDGSVKGETFVKKYTDVGRNDPCPCGSGKKFKKCCLKLIS